MTYGMDAPASFATPPVVPSTFINDGTIKSMATSLGLQMAAEAGKGFYPVSIAFDTPDQSGHKLEDKNLGRHSVTVSCKGRFRFQNVTEAEGEHGNNINAIDANPVSGKIYTFKISHLFLLPVMLKQPVLRLKMVLENLTLCHSRLNSMPPQCLLLLLVKGVLRLLNPHLL